MAKISLDRFQLQFISHQNEKMSYLDGIREALAGGCKWIQLRMKGATDEEVRPIALKVKEWCKEQNATFLIDDRVQLVKELQVDGVHLGKNDMPIAEARKILGDASIEVNPTAVRVPVFFGHSEAVAIETRKKVTPEAARALLEQSPGVEVVDERKAGGYPTPVTHASGNDAVYVGRIREDFSHPRGLNLWIVSDNIRKGAALNAVQLAELVAQEG